MKGLSFPSSKSNIADFYEFTHQRSMKLLEEVDHWLEDHHQQVEPGQEESVDTERLGIGLYCIQGENETKSHTNV